ncbi:olfactory receptor 6N1-like [Electrophorus electricus]|uniref:olfactory receptor 6N1-like n=1 Tax=Electrophorus electricus TaxID=8005 RepID=UPI0015D02221|nr:olfactory receptor 6N1-like [Electrophorus electricus]
MNTTKAVTYFIIEGLKDKYFILFSVFLIIYLLVLGGNSMIMYLVRTDCRLNSPMYYFLDNLSFCDMIYTTVTIPNMLSGFLVEVKTISKTGCLVQMYVFLSMSVTGRALLTVMAFDRYLAICHPLRYTSVMTRKVCFLLIFLAWFFGWILPLPSLILAVPLPFCGPNIVKHIFCDHSSLVSLACTNTTNNNLISLIFALYGLIGTFLLILASYISIGKTIIRMGSAEQLKAFGTCGSHLIVVCISYVSASCVYISYRVTMFDSEVRLVFVVLYSVLTPLLNPFIYSLRNKELQDAFKRAFSRCNTVSHTSNCVRKAVPSIS